MKLNGYSAIGAIGAVLLLGACAQTDMDAMRADVPRNSQAVQQVQQDQTAMRNEIRAAAQGAQQAAQSAQAAAQAAQQAPADARAAREAAEAASMKAERITNRNLRK